MTTRPMDAEEHAVWTTFMLALSVADRSPRWMIAERADGLLSEWRARRPWGQSGAQNICLLDDDEPGPKPWARREPGFLDPSDVAESPNISHRYRNHEQEARASAEATAAAAPRGKHRGPTK